jgi:hypothetical protein
MTSTSTALVVATESKGELATMDPHEQKMARLEKQRRVLQMEGFLMPDVPECPQCLADGDVIAGETISGPLVTKHMHNERYCSTTQNCAALFCASADYHAGHNVCRNCGEILGGQLISDASEWRTFEADAGEFLFKHSDWCSGFAAFTGASNKGDPDRVGGPEDEMTETYGASHLQILALVLISLVALRLVDHDR